MIIEICVYLQGLGTNDSVLMRVIISRAEVDLKEIKDKFQQITNESLAKMVEGETSGDYKKAMLAIINGN